MKRAGTYYIVCIEAEGIIVACATLIVEHKFLHECGQVWILAHTDVAMTTNMMLLVRAY